MVLDADYAPCNAQPACSASYLWDPVRAALRRELPNGGAVLEMGCGNGSLAGMLLDEGYAMTGIDPSESGIQIARAGWPGGRFEVGSAYDDGLVERYGRFAVVISLEVVEHCFWPRRFAASIHALLRPGGLAIISTPYHGYTKNLLLALANRFDAHWSPLWDGGHIKFWSRRTLDQLLRDAGFNAIEFTRVGRIPPVAKSMIALARKPA